jgi:hypothetical protein
MVRTNEHVPYGFGDEYYDTIDYTDIDEVLDAMDSIEPLDSFAALYVNAVVAVMTSDEGDFHFRYIPKHKALRVELDSTSYIELDPEDTHAPIRVYETRFESYLVPQSGIDEGRVRRYLIDEFRSWWRLVESLNQ